MTDYKATAEQWDDCGAFASDTRACTVRELRARVEALEAMRETEKAAVLDLYQQHDKLKEWVGRNYIRIKALEGDKTDPTNSLVSRVAGAISGIGPKDALNWTLEARAAIDVIVGELRAQCFVAAADWLEQETKRD